MMAQRYEHLKTDTRYKRGAAYSENGKKMKGDEE